MITLVLFFMLDTPLLPFFDGCMPLPNPKPEDCIIVPLENPKVDYIVGRYLVVTA